MKFTSLKNRKVEASFSGGSITSDGGILLLREVEKKIKLLEKASKVIPDLRDPEKVTHKTETMLQQRVFGLALGYEDLNDHSTLRNDIAFQVGVNSTKELASSPTLCRFENSTNRKIAFDIHKVILDKFIESRKSEPEELVLDFDATDDLVHGNQVGRFFHGYYKNYCFLPLYVFCGRHLLVSYLRPSNKDAAKHAWAILSLLSKRFRQAWPKVKITFRGDTGFCRHEMFDWCERKDISYITGVAGNNRLYDKLGPLLTKQKNNFRKLKRNNGFLQISRTKPVAGQKKDELSEKQNILLRGQIQDLLLLTYLENYKNFMTIAIVLVVIWKIESKNNNLIYLLIEPPAIIGGQINSDFFLHHLPIP